MKKMIVLIICLSTTIAYAQADAEFIAKQMAKNSIQSYKLNPNNALDAIARVYPSKAQQLQACLKNIDSGSSDSEVESCMVMEIVSVNIPPQ